jgi:23S rRNA (guanosine2251-2'-O)-methyltransferase
MSVAEVAQGIVGMGRKRRFNHAPRSTLRVEKTDPAGAGEWLYGVHAVRAALEQSGNQFTALWLDKRRIEGSLQQIAKLARERGLVPCLVDREELETLIPGARHQGAVAHYLPPAGLTEEKLFALVDHLGEPPLLLLLDGVQDPHNLGACLRTAEAAGVHAVVAPKDRAVGLTGVVRKVASGAAERVPFAPVTNLVRTMEKLRERGLWLVGTEAEGEESLYAMDLRGPLGLVLGAEDRGLRRLTREYCDHLVAIPLQGQVGSLNVSVAAGICLFEVRRQRGFAL